MQGHPADLVVSLALGLLAAVPAAIWTAMALVLLAWFAAFAGVGSRLPTGLAPTS